MPSESETVYVEDPPTRIYGNVLIDGPDGQCTYIYPGIEERCPEDAVAHTFINRGGEPTRVEMCADHAREDIPAPSSINQQGLATDGGTAASEERRVGSRRDVTRSDTERFERKNGYPGRLLLEHYGVAELVLVNLLRVFSHISLWHRLFPPTVHANGHPFSHVSFWTSTYKTVVTFRSRETNAGGDPA